MKSLTENNRLVWASAIIAVSLVVCAIIGASTANRMLSRGRTISVTGAAFKSIRSNFARWEGRFQVNATTLDEAYPDLRRDLNIVLAFLKERGFDSSQVAIGTIRIIEKQNRERELVGYNLIQSVEIESTDIDHIDRLSRAASSLIEQGVSMESLNPRYLFTELDQLKLQMIKAATENALLRAEQLAESTDRTVGAPTSARVGVFQIRALHSQDVSGMGVSDEWSIDKEIVSTVHVSFLIE